MLHVRLKSNGDYWQAYCKGYPTRSLGPKSKLSRRGAEAKCREWEFELRGGTTGQPFSPPPPSAPRLSQWLEQCAAQRSDLADGTKRVNRFCGKYLMRHFAADPPIDQIDRRQAAEWRAALAAGTLSLANAQHTKAPCEQTICKHVRAARKIFGEAFAQDLIDLNPFDRLRCVPPSAVREWAYLDAEAMRHVFDACPDATWKAFFGLMRYCGLRLGEALRLRWTDVDFARNRMNVNAPGTITKVDNKKRPRMVPIELSRCPSGFAAILQLAWSAAPTGTVRVCEGLPGGKIEKRTAAILAAAGVAKYAKVHHTLRKNAEQDWAAHYPQHAVSDWAGHSITVSAAHYLRVPEELYQAPACTSAPPPPPALAAFPKPCLN